jgi:alanine-glyoxylate transaminase/serine-glyoxylate transaminase/serine-pyruvate transaminase
MAGLVAQSGPKGKIDATGRLDQGPATISDKGHVMLANGRTYLAIPGPSVMPDRVLNAMHRAAPNIYAQDLADMSAGLARDLARIIGTEGRVAMYIGNGHAAWEAALANVLSPGDGVLILATGQFGHGWAAMATGLGLAVTLLDFGFQALPDLDRVRAALVQDPAIKAVLLCHVDTASGLRTDPAPIRALLDEMGHPALLAVDCIASLACDAYDMDAMGADITVAACQKGLMTPPGLAFVAFNARAAEQRAQMPRVSAYWDWVPRTNATGLSQFWDGTAPTHHLFGLRAALDMIHEEGLPQVLDRHARLARAVWAAVTAWGQGRPIRLNLAAAGLRSHAVTSVHLPDGGALRLQDWCRDQAGLTLGYGLGRTPVADWLRIGHMGHVNAQMIMGVLATMEAGMVALGIPHGPGAIAAAARALMQD